MGCQSNMAEKKDKYRVPIQIPKGSEDFVKFAPVINTATLLGSIQSEAYSNPDFSRGVMFVGQVQRPGMLREYVAFTSTNVIRLTSLLAGVAGIPQQWGDLTFAQDRSIYSHWEQGLEGWEGSAEEKALEPFKKMFILNLKSSTLMQDILRKMTREYGSEGKDLPAKGRVMYRDNENEVTVRSAGTSSIRINIADIETDTASLQLVSGRKARPEYRSNLYGSSKSVDWLRPTMRWFADDFGQRVININPMDDQLFFACLARLQKYLPGAYDSVPCLYFHGGLKFTPDRFNPLVGLMSIAYMMKHERSSIIPLDQREPLKRNPAVLPLVLIRSIPSISRSSFYEKSERYFKRWEAQEGNKAIA